MLYLTTPSTPQVRDVMRSGAFGAMMNPGDGKTSTELRGIAHAVDNGCFSRWEPFKWLRALDRWSSLQPDCLFVVAPDVVADFDATLERSRPWFSAIRALGHRVAFVAQDGLDMNRVPWDEFDVWFTGGSDAWKLCQQSWEGMEEAKRRGKWCHLGRVNGGRKLAVAAAGGYDSADGTYIRFGPDVNLPKVLRWIAAIEHAPTFADGVTSP